MSWDQEIVFVNCKVIKTILTGGWQTVTEQLFLNISYLVYQNLLYYLRNYYHYYYWFISFSYSSLKNPKNLLRPSLHTKSQHFNSVILTYKSLCVFVAGFEITQLLFFITLNLLKLPSYFLCRQNITAQVRNIYSA